MSNYIFCFLFLSCLTDLVATRNAFLDSSGANCEADYKPNEIIDITSIEDEGKANFLGAKKSASEINCAELCCKSFTPDLPNSPQVRYFIVYCICLMFFMSCHEILKICNVRSGSIMCVRP